MPCHELHHTLWPKSVHVMGCSLHASALQMLWDIIQTGHYNFSVEVQNDGSSEVLL